MSRPGQVRRPWEDFSLLLDSLAARGSLAPAAARRLRRLGYAAADELGCALAEAEGGLAGATAQADGGRAFVGEVAQRLEKAARDGGLASPKAGAGAAADAAW